MIAVHQLARQFGSVRALAGVDFELAAGTLVGLIGPNGAGKTTLLRILATLCAPDSGSARVAGFDCVQEAEAVRRLLGFVPENPPVIPEARVDEYLNFRATLHDLPRSKRLTAVDRVLEQCQLRDVRRRLARHLSHGYRRRLSLAEALLNDPPVLLLDEPTVGLDPLQIRHTRDLLTSLIAGRTILISTHLLADAETLCQRVLVMLRGRIVGDVQASDLSAVGFEAELRGPVETIGRWIEAEFAAAELTVLADGWCRVRVSQPSADHRRSEDRRADLAEQCARQGWSLRELRRTTDSLEERFIRLTIQARAA